MPCWYYDKKALRATPSFKDGLDPELESRYRREGARFIIDNGTKMGLRYDTCATGVVYFHRFYMFHSFKEFHRYVTAACCLFLAGKVEETPKKCKDIIKTTRSMLTDAQFAVFGEDPKEEVMTLERILLQTIKFDLQVDHPYTYLLKFSKIIKGDKNKVQKMVQMGWTFINDSLCTTLCLQWEADVIAVALMYLASRLSKFDIQDWQGRTLGHKGKWWDFLVQDTTLELLEDICHQVLDLYSATPQQGDESPPPPPPPPPKPGTTTKHSRPSTPQEQSKAHITGPPPAKMAKYEPEKPAALTTKPPSSYSSHNPYVGSNMYNSSFMSQEGSESIQSILGGRGSHTAQQQYSTTVTQAPSAPYTQSAPYSQQQAYSKYPAQQQQPPPPAPKASSHYPQQQYYAKSTTPTQQQYPQYQATVSGAQQTATAYPAQYSASPYSQQYSGQYPAQGQPTRPPAPPPPSTHHAKTPTGLPVVRITGRR